MANVGDKRERDVDDNKDSDSDEEIDYDTVVSYRKATDEEFNEYYSQAYRSKGFTVPVVGTIHGGIEPHDFTDETDKQLVTDLAKQAMEFYNIKYSTSFEFDQIVKVNSQVVAGFMFYITFTGRSAGNNTSETFYGKVWKKIYDLGSIVKFCETDLERISCL